MRIPRYQKRFNCHGPYGLASICDENTNFKSFILQQFTAYKQFAAYVRMAHKKRPQLCNGVMLLNDRIQTKRYNILKSRVISD